MKKKYIWIQKRGIVKMSNLPKEFDFFDDDAKLIEELIITQSSDQSARRIYFCLKRIWFELKLKQIENSNKLTELEIYKKMKCIKLLPFQDWTDNDLHEITRIVNSFEASYAVKKYYLLSFEKLSKRIGKKDWIILLQEDRDDLHNSSKFISNEEFITIEDSEDILDGLAELKDNTMANNRQPFRIVLYFAYCILAFTGMRVGGLSILKKSDIIFNELDSEGYRRLSVVEKATKKNRFNTYFLPPYFIDELKEYCETLPGEFIIPRNNTTMNCSVVRRIEAEFANFGLNPHKLRDCMNSSWASLGIDQDIRSIFANQNPEGVNSQNYLRKFKSLALRKKYYDIYNPYRMWLEKRYKMSYLEFLEQNYPNFDEDYDGILIDQKVRKKSFRDGTK